MKLSLFKLALAEISSLGCQIKRISFNHYNEPLLDPYLIQRIGAALRYNFFDHILLNNNLSILNRGVANKLFPAIDRIAFNVNLPTCNEKRYRQLQGVDRYHQVESNLRWLIKRGFKVRVNVQENPLITREDSESVVSKFGNLVEIERVSSISRAGLIKLLAPGKNQGGRKKKLLGCKINRPINYLHIGVNGEIFLCCQDYFKKYKFGDLTLQPLEKIVSSQKVQVYLEFIYGRRMAPDKFICRNCEFAIFSVENNQPSLLSRAFDKLLTLPTLCALLAVFQMLDEKL